MFIEEWLETEVNLLEDIHMRPIQKINQTAKKFKSKVFFHFGENNCNAKSFLSLLEIAPMMHKTGDRTFKIRASGVDAQCVIDAFSKMS